TGFAFLTQSNGNVLAVTKAGEKTLGITPDASGVNRLLSASNQPAISNLKLPTDDKPVLSRVTLSEGGQEVPYVVLLKELRPTNFYAGKGPVVAEALSLGFMVPEREIYASLIAAKSEIAKSARGIIAWQAAAVLLSLV